MIHLNSYSASFSSVYIFGLLFDFWFLWSGAGIKWDLGVHRGVGLHPGLTALVLPTVTIAPGCTAPRRVQRKAENRKSHSMLFAWGEGRLVSNAQRKNNKATTIGQKLCIFSPVNRVFLHTHQYEEMKNNLIIFVMMCI